MNIHLIPNDKFAIKFIDFVKSNFDDNNHKFYIYGEPNFIKENTDGVIVLSNFDDVNLSLAKGKDKIFVHSFYDHRIIKYLFKNYFKLNKEQVVFIIYGSDLYNARFELQKNRFDLKLNVFELLKRTILKKSNKFMTFAAPDYELLHKWYGANGKQFDCLYPSNIDKEYLDKIRDINKHSDKVRILVGNSATSTNKHLEAFEMLKKYNTENIEIVCPLSYGSEDELEYKNIVTKKGKEYFGDKFVPIFNYMSIEEYCDLLNSVDVAVFNNNRQQATANIEILGYLGKKIYIRSDTTTWGHYVERDHCRFFDTILVKDMSYADFIKNSLCDIENNTNYFTKIWDINYVKSLWEDVINS